MCKQRLDSLIFFDNVFGITFMLILLTFVYQQTIRLLGRLIARRPKFIKYILIFFCQGFGKNFPYSIFQQCYTIRKMSVYFVLTIIESTAFARVKSMAFKKSKHP